jgi:hypothetical protein
MIILKTLAVLYRYMKFILMITFSPASWSTLTILRIWGGVSANRTMASAAAERSTSIILSMSPMQPLFVYSACCDDQCCQVTNSLQGRNHLVFSDSLHYKCNLCPFVLVLNVHWGSQFSIEN